MTKKRSRSNGDGDVWPRKNKAGKIIGYRGAYWVQTPDGPKRRYVSGKTKKETRDALWVCPISTDCLPLSYSGTSSQSNFFVLRRAEMPQGGVSSP